MNTGYTLPGRIIADGCRFTVNGREIWMNGVNTPWNHWNDFGGNFDAAFWDTHFAGLRAAGINSSRIWISCNGDVGILIDEKGYVSGATQKYWEELDRYFALAEKNGIYVMATLMSFDHFKDENKNYRRWRAMVADENATEAYVQNFVVPFCRRYGSGEVLWSIDLCNEPDWVQKNEECGQISWQQLSRLFAREAAAIHKSCDALVTCGMAVVTNNSEKYDGNYIGDNYLQGLYADRDAYMDFYSPHYYEWMAPVVGMPFDKTPQAFGLEADRPAVLAEFPAAGFEGTHRGAIPMSPVQCYVGAYENGWNGVMAWTSNGIDRCGDLKDIEPAAREILARAGEKVFPYH